MYSVSVIIPIYNVEGYLRQCLDSVVNQILKDIEIILVDDGSTDSSPRICDEYASKDSRIKVIHKQNEGLGKAYNVGLDNATAEYIGLIESDDFIELDMFEGLYNEAVSNNLDVIRSDFYLYTTKDNSNEEFDQSWVKHNEVYCPIEDEPKVFLQKPSIWANLYNAEFLRKNDIKFLETRGASYQDVSFSFKVYACAKRYKMINNRYVHYRIDNENSSVNATNKLYCVCEEYSEIERFIKSKGRYDEFKYIIPRMKYACYCWNFNHLQKDLKYTFLKQFSKEYRMHILKSEIDKKLFSKREIKRIYKIAFIPFIYKEREAL